MRLIFIFVKLNISLQAAKRLPILLPLLLLFFFPLQAVRKRNSHVALTVDKATRRMRATTDRKDFMQHMIAPGSLSISESEIIGNCSTIIIAGSETSATTLSGITYYLTGDPARLQRLVDEVRSAFKTDAEINMTNVGALPYLKACIEESLRVYPPTPAGLPRKVPGKGATIAGRWVPGGVSSHLLSKSSHRDGTDIDACRPASPCQVGPWATRENTSATPTPTRRSAGSMIRCTPTTS